MDNEVKDNEVKDKRLINSIDTRRITSRMYGYDAAMEGKRDEPESDYRLVEIYGQSAKENYLFRLYYHIGFYEACEWMDRLHLKHENPNMDGQLYDKYCMFAAKAYMHGARVGFLMENAEIALDRDYVSKIRGDGDFRRLMDACWFSGYCQGVNAKIEEFEIMYETDSENKSDIEENAESIEKEGHKGIISLADRRREGKKHDR